MTGGGEAGSRPEVVVVTASLAQAAHVLREVCAGLEEEGVPVRVVEHSGTAADLARSAADRSELSVGVGLDAEHVVVTHARLPRGAPLLVRGLPGAPPALLRRVGHDAARLVTTRPLTCAPDEGPRARGGPHRVDPPA